MNVMELANQWGQTVYRAAIGELNKSEELSFKSLYGFVDQLSEKGSEPACRANCYYCCYERVDVLPVEAELMARFIKRRPGKFAGLTHKLKRTIGIGEHLGVDLYRRSHTPCPLLRNGRCSVYPVRPILCRGYVSYDRQACARRLYKGDDTPGSLYVTVSARAIHAAVGKKVNQEPMFMPRALLEAL